MLRYTRKEQKQAAKNDLNGRWGVSIGSFLMATYVPMNVVMLPAVFLIFAGAFFGAAGNDVLGLSIISISYLLLFVPLFLVSGPLYMGYYLFNLRIARGDEAGWALPYRCFTKGIYGRLTKGYFMWTLIILLWTCLLIVPGIIKSLSYAQVPYLMMDHPEMTWQEAMKESARMMQGHKWDLFVLQLSFIGWLLLAEITYFVSMIYSGPYMYQAFVNFYRDLKGEPLNVAKAASYEMPH